MIWFYHKKLQNFDEFINNNSLVLVFLFDMANTILFKAITNAFQKLLDECNGKLNKKYG